MGLDEEVVTLLHDLDEVIHEQRWPLLSRGEDVIVNHGESKVSDDAIVGCVQLSQVLEVFLVTVSFKLLLLLEDVTDYETGDDDDVLNDLDEFE